MLNHLPDLVDYSLSFSAVTLLVGSSYHKIISKWPKMCGVGHKTLQ